MLFKELRRGSKVNIRKLLRLSTISFLVVITICGLILVLNHTNYLDYEKPIPFKEYDRITFENFRGISLFKKNLYGNEKFAYVNTSIEIEISNKSISLNSYFHPSRSYVYDKKSLSKELLSHEKYHFKITELFTRKAKKRFSELKEFNKKEIVNIVQEIQKDERRYQEKYDYDTFHSYVYSEQVKYEDKIDSMLNNLANFDKTKIKL